MGLYPGSRSTMITTNLNLEELEKKVGDHTMDRLIGSCRIVENARFKLPAGKGIINKKMEAFNEQNNSYPGNERGG